jgi:hypothetical protein
MLEPKAELSKAAGDRSFNSFLMGERAAKFMIFEPER